MKPQIHSISPSPLFELTHVPGRYIPGFTGRAALGLQIAFQKKPRRQWMDGQGPGKPAIEVEHLPAHGRRWSATPAHSSSCAHSRAALTEKRLNCNFIAVRIIHDTSSPVTLFSNPSCLSGVTIWRGRAKTCARAELVSPNNIPVIMHDQGHVYPESEDFHGRGNPRVKTRLLLC